jgi:predicted peroxiredoxin
MSIKYKDFVNELGHFKCPATSWQGSMLAEARDIPIACLMGATQSGAVALTKDQVKKLERWFPVEEDESSNSLGKAMDFRNLMRSVEAHGVRLMAFLASRNLLEKNKDPVLSLAEMLTGAGFLEEVVLDIEDLLEEEKEKEEQ